MGSDFYLFWIQNNRQPRLESVVDRIFAPRNRHEVRAALAEHRRKWRKRSRAGQ